MSCHFASITWRKFMDAVLAQRLLVNDQVAVSGKLVAAAILVVK